jgi:hypothetical protein
MDKGGYRNMSDTNSRNERRARRLWIGALTLMLSTMTVAPVLAANQGSDPSAEAEVAEAVEAAIPVPQSVAIVAAADPIDAAAVGDVSAEADQADQAEAIAQDAIDEPTPGAVSDEATSDEGASDATASEEADTAPTEIGGVNIGDGSRISVKDVTILPGESNSVVTFTLDVHNGSNADLQFINYWVHLQSKSGVKFSVSIRQEDQDKNKIPPTASQDIHFYAKISPQFSLQDLQFNIIAWDFTRADFERSLGFVDVPDDYSLVTPESAARTITLSGTPVSTKVKRVTMTTNEKYNTPVITFLLKNIGTRSVTLPAYQYYIRTSEGLLYPLSVAGVAKDQAIFPRLDKELQLSGSLPLELGTDGWELLITQTDDAAKLTLPVAYYTLPAPDTGQNAEAVPVGKTKVLDADSNTVETKVEKVTSTVNDKYVNKIVYFEIKNTGSSSIVVPVYRFALKTADGLTYPMTADDFNKLAIDPVVTKEVKLHATIPAEVSAAGARLVVSSAASGDAQSTDSDPGIPLASYELPADNEGQLAAGDQAEFSNDSGVYEVKLNAIQRLPWQDQDILAAGITVSNTSADSLPIPELTGKFVLDNSIDIPVKTIRLDNVIGIQRDGKVNFQLYGMIPYTYQYSTLKLVLQEKVDDKTTDDLMTFQHDTDTLLPQFVSVDDSYQITNVGRSVSIAVLDVRSYEDSDSNLMTVLLNVQNMEKRDSSVPNLVAYFKTNDDTMYKADITQATGKLGPRSVATLLVSSTIPKEKSEDGDTLVNTKFDSLQLIVGIGVSDSNGGIANGGDTGTPVAYVSAASFALPAERDRPLYDFKSLRFPPYMVSMTNFKAGLLQAPTPSNGMQGKFHFTFDYDVTKSALLEAGTDEHTILLEFKDTDTGVYFTQEMTIGKSDGLPVGNGTKEVVLTDPNIMSKLAQMKDYQLSVYDKYKGLEKLLAEESHFWEE